MFPICIPNTFLSHFYLLHFIFVEKKRIKEFVSIPVMKIQISDVMKSALHARCGEKYIVQERGEVDIYVSLLIL